MACQICTQKLYYVCQKSIVHKNILPRKSSEFSE
nr:MAG TPA: hypothetical protein [Caudoviricetes sp.]DAT40910.1 MAG TPA: hypothetical protein [Caudoviricetes sp.]